MLYVVGLGNPGPEYNGTRHNVGFDVIDELAERHRFPAETKFGSSLVRRDRIRGQEVLLVKPTTYMNLSGDAVGAIVRFYKGDVSDIIVVHDDLDFEPGQVRIKVGGGHGGHNGLSSIMSHVGRDFVRIRLGIGKPTQSQNGSDHVLSGFGAADRRIIDDGIDTAADAVEAVIDEGARKAANRFNRRAPTEEESNGEENEESNAND